MTAPNSLSTATDELAEWLNDQVRFHESSVASKDPAIQGHVAFLRRAIARISAPAQAAQEPDATVEEIQRLILIEFSHQHPESRRAAERVWNLINARAKTLARQTTTSVLPRSEGQAAECDGGLRTLPVDFGRKIEAAWDIEPTPFNRADVAVRVANAALAAPQPASNAATGDPWTPAGYWECVSSLAGKHEAGQMRDMLAERGLQIVGISDLAPEWRGPMSAALWTGRLVIIAVAVALAYG